MTCPGRPRGSPGGRRSNQGGFLETAVQCMCLCGLASEGVWPARSEALEEAWQPPGAKRFHRVVREQSLETWEEGLGPRVEQPRQALPQAGSV